MSGERSSNFQTFGPGSVTLDADAQDAIVAEGLTKRYGKHAVVDGLSFVVGRGRVVGFLGPNGSGKTTTLRMLTGLVRPHGGSATVLARPLAELGAVARRIGTLVEAPGFYGGNSGRTNLRIHARLAGVSDQRVEAVLGQVGLLEHARKKVEKYSLGMRQRLGIANALLTDPELLILDEPMNGLDPAGTAALRELLISVAHGGGTVFISSHQLGEIQAMCDEVVLINHGRLVQQGPVEGLTGRSARQLVVTPELERTAAVLAAAGLAASVERDCVIVVGAGHGERIGRALMAEQIPISALHEENETLEALFVELTDSAEGWIDP